MQRFVRLDTDFYQHPKFVRLRGLLGDVAFRVLPALWCVAAKFAPDGDLSKFSDQELALQVQCDGEGAKMIQALKDSGFLGGDKRLHDWQEHNSWHVFHVQRARKAAKRRWATGQKRQDMTREETTGHDRTLRSIASSNASSMGGEKPSSSANSGKKGQWGSCAVENLCLPESLNTEDFKNVLARWLDFRPNKKKIVGDAVKFFQNQVDILATYPADVAKCILEASLSNQWQGLFDPQTRKTISRQGGGNGNEPTSEGHGKYGGVPVTR